MYPKLPNHDEYKLIPKLIPTKKLILLVKNLQFSSDNSNTPINQITTFFGSIDFQSWQLALINRIYDPIEIPRILTFFIKVKICHFPGT